MSIDDRLRAWVEAIDGDLTVPVEAAKFVAQLREQDPHALSAWLDDHAESIVSERMRKLLTSDRARAQRRGAAREFATNAERAEAGENPARPSLAWFVVDESHTRRRLRDMTYADLDFAASDYEVLSKSNAFEAAYLRAVQKRLPKNNTKVVSDVLSDDLLSALRTAAA